MDINDKLDVIIMGLTTGPRLFNIVGKNQYRYVISIGGKIGIGMLSTL